MWREAVSVSVLLTALSFTWLVLGVREALEWAKVEARVAREEVLEEVRVTREQLLEEIRATRLGLQGEVSGLNRQLQSELTRLNSTVVIRLEDLQRQVERGLTSAQENLLEEVQIIRSDASQVLRSSNRLVELITPQVLGLTAASKVAAGELAQTARTWRRETPAIAVNVREATANVKEATKLSKWQKALLLMAAGAAVVGVLR